MKTLNENVQIKKNKNKKMIYLILLLLLVFSIFTGVVLAYFSDMIDQSGQVSTGTLKISGNYIFYVNGTETAIDNINNLNPGDVIIIKANVSNNGNKSAWIREMLTIDINDESVLEYFQVYNGEFNQADFISNNDLTEYSLPLTSGIAVSSNKVINGSGNYAEVESGEDYNYIGNANYQTVITIYFTHTATNEAQGKTFNLVIATQALQFRNNNTSEPNESAWSTVSSVSVIK